MERKTKFMNFYYKLDKKDCLKMFIFKHLILLLYLNLIKSFQLKKKNFYYFLRLMKFH